MAGGPCFYTAPTATRHAATYMAGSGTAFRDGRTGSGKSVGDVGLVLNCATPPKAAICVREQCFEHLETCRVPIFGFRTCSRLSKRQRKRGYEEGETPRILNEVEHR
jgi:hypothetical protein